MTTGTGAGGASGALVMAALRSGAVLSVWPDRLESAGITYPLADIAWAALVNDPAAPQGMPPAPAVAWRMADGRYVSATPTDPPQTWQILEALFTQRPDLRTPLPPPPPPPGYAPYPPYGYAAYAQPQRNDNQQAGGRVTSDRPELPLDEREAWRAGQLGIVLGLARWLRRLGVSADAPPALTVAPDALTVTLPADVPWVEDEWLDGLVRGCRRYLDRALVVTSLA